MPIYEPTSKNLQRAAQLLRDGELVALPTETVYGLGANALDERAVQKIFALKGRPAFNPLIVHVLDTKAAKMMVDVWPSRAQILAEAFWPGALTLVLPKRDIVPDPVTAGLPSVALRAPSHEVARRLLEIVQLPLAAPSANKYTQTSPTRACHVAQSLGDDLCVLDGGACTVGIESTVLDLTTSTPTLLRPGTILQADIEAALNEKLHIEYSNDEDDAPRRAPGQVRRHYSPRAKLVIATSGIMRDAMQNAASRTARTGAVVWSDENRLDETVFEFMQTVRLSNNALQYAARFYDALHQLDAHHCDVIFVEEVPQSPDWNGVRDRIQRAASK